jgi:hypothetical protein
MIINGFAPCCTGDNRHQMVTTLKTHLQFFVFLYSLSLLVTSLMTFLSSSSCVFFIRYSSLFFAVGFRMIADVSSESIHAVYLSVSVRFIWIFLIYLCLHTPCMHNGLNLTLFPSAFTLTERLANEAFLFRLRKWRWMWNFCLLSFQIFLCKV